jgi:DNA-binding NarL/FixJ family response regulator
MPKRSRPEDQDEELLPNNKTAGSGFNKPYRIIIADDHSVVRLGLRMLLEQQPGVEIVSEASNGVEALEQTRQHKPDLAIVDLTMPQMNGLELVRTIHAELPGTAVMVLTMHFSDDLAREVLKSGALAYVLKSDADNELLAALDQVRHGQPFFTSRLAVSMAQNFIDAGDASAGGAPALPLTERELQVVTLLAKGKSNKEVATELQVSTRTVESHRNHIMKKMEFESFSDLVRFAVRNNLVEP